MRTGEKRRKGGEGRQRERTREKINGCVKKKVTRMKIDRVQGREMEWMREIERDRDRETERGNEKY